MGWVAFRVSHSFRNHGENCICDGNCVTGENWFPIVDQVHYKRHNDKSGHRCESCHKLLLHTIYECYIQIVPPNRVRFLGFVGWEVQEQKKQSEQQVN